MTERVSQATCNFTPSADGFQRLFCEEEETNGKSEDRAFLE